ncbi:MAG: DNA-3-methyladenine glycosylase [Gammaproteobacteria bacterium]|nr:DNA-3-methyladenine glycosylase [Gammaproteobacteria bacterium]
MKLNRQFYLRDTLDVAEGLLGKMIVREQDNVYMKALIVETEAYIGKEDTACHASKGLTPRTKVMFGECGHAYVYFVYGMHYMLNIVTEKTDFPAAVLIRAVEPVEGIEMMTTNRNATGKNISNGPAKLCQALDIDKSFNNWDLTKGEKLWIEENTTPLKYEIVTSPRIGIDYAEKKDRIAAWRFFIKHNPYVSQMFRKTK